MAHDPTELSPAERLLEEFLTPGRTLDPGEVTVMAQHYTRETGIGDATVYLSDIQQNQLVPIGGGATIPIDGTSAGWAYRTTSLRVTENTPEAGLLAWFPLLDGAERLGVVRIATPVLDHSTLRRCRTLASLLAKVISSNKDTSDTYAHRTRTEPMSLPAEMLRAFLPPRTLATPLVVSTAVLEPAYDLGGDAFDHALHRGVLHAAVIDAMGHDLASGLTSSLALAACRNSRRNGADLPELVRTIDQTLAQWLPDRHATGIMLRLALDTGTLTWSNCAHPAPLLIRRQTVVPDALTRTPELPMGLGALFAHPQPRAVHTASLEPGDRVLLYTDGVVEARDTHGDLFGLERFAEYVIRATAAGSPAPEVLRRLVHALLASKDSTLTDDATIMMIEWQPPGPRSRTSPAPG